MLRTFAACALLACLCLLASSRPAYAANPKIVFEKQPAPLPGNPPPPGALEYKLKWTDCTNAKKLAVNYYEILPGNPPPPPKLIGGIVLDPIPGGANGSILIQTAGLPPGKKVNFKSKVVDNAGLTIAEETSVTTTVP